MTDLVVRDLTVGRGGLPVLSGVAFSLPPGHALVLRGPNGSGKTTLLRTIAGLQPPMAGEIDGAEDRVAYAAHADGVKGTLSVVENLAFWAGVYGTGTLDNAMTRFDLQTLQDRPARSLSAGQKRRLGLARLAVTGRDVWVLDEPTVSLDTASVAGFARTIGAHLEQGGSALIATHIDLGLDAETLEVTRFTPDAARDAVFDEAFL